LSVAAVGASARGARAPLLVSSVVMITATVLISAVRKHYRERDRAVRSSR
jgi:hypothetical protein